MCTLADPDFWPATVNKVVNGGWSFKPLPPRNPPNEQSLSAYSLGEDSPLHPDAWYAKNEVGHLINISLVDLKILSAGPKTSECPIASK